jgi:hypothetical protein
MEEFTRCSVCTRMPLVGEEVTVMCRANREAPVCDLCLQKPRAGTLGEAVRRERIHSAGGGGAVRRVIPEPVPAPSPVSLFAGVSVRRSV